MIYKVIRPFVDLQDCSHAYRGGDIFPREGLTVSDQRINELASSNNRRGVPLIIQTQDVQECISEVKEEPLKTETAVSTPEVTKAKGRAKKTRGKAC
jgi:hypothetical protein